MQLNTIFSRVNLAVAGLLFLLAGALLLAGCQTAGDTDASAHDHSSGQGSCH